MNVLMIVSRVIHILFGVLWAGGAMMMTGFVGPTAKAIGPDAKAFMQHLTLRGKFSGAMAWAAVLTTLSGVAMYWYLFRGISISTGAGLALTFGGLFGLIAFLIGFLGMKANTDKMRALVDEIIAAGGPPQPEQLAAIQSFNEQIAKTGALQTLVILLSLFGMTLSEYFAI